MPSLARKVIICAAVDGLILQPLSSKKDQRPPNPVKIRYGDAGISQVSRDALADLTKSESSFEAFGVVGLISVSKFNYLISITRRQQVATIRGSPIYVVTEVALTPCTSHKDATEAITNTNLHTQRHPIDKSADGSSSSSEDEDTELPLIVTDEADDDASSVEDGQRPASAAERQSSVAQDVISKRGSYGRFAQRWFSKSGWMQDQKRSMGLTERTNAEAAAKAAAEKGSKEAMVEETERAQALAESTERGRAAGGLLPKLLRTTQILFGSSKSFFFAYDYDVTRSLAQQQKAASPDTSLHELVDPLYFWNRHALQPFIDAGAGQFALPMMQGFVGQRSFVVDSQPPQMDDVAKDSLELNDMAQRSESTPASPPTERTSVDLRPTEKRFDITVISRRSIKRAGLRYHRRGIDDEGFVANSVETEQILSPSQSEGPSKKYSFLQVRGSIPVFFKQSPYSLKPVPILQHSEETNYGALKKHFDRLRDKYGSLQVVNLVEKHGTEGKVGDEFERLVKRLNEESGETSKVPFEWFDFHNACRGMKFENVSLLLDTLGSEVIKQGSTVEDGDQITARQTGALRTNCMDCLDRTNVCQSSFAKFMLDLQLKEQGFDMAAQRDQENAWFNNLWADNGDAISKQYASTGAMKGDYTRTRKRDYRGALTDVGLSLTRFYNGMVNDFFIQATIDFLLGNVTSLIFEEFESNMMTKDPAVSMQRMREQAIELCQKRVVADESEEFIGGWTLLSPHIPDSVTSQSFEEVVLLLTDAALYLCRFDWNSDKVSSFERVELCHIEKIKIGTYITATLTRAQTDEERNVGFVVTYSPGFKDITRVNTRSLSSLTTKSSKDASGGPLNLSGLLSRRTQPAQQPPNKRLALKALYSQSSAAVTVSDSGPKLSEKEQVAAICSEIERLVQMSKPTFAGTERAAIVESGEIVSLAEARRSTGYLEQLGHSLKKMVWA